MKKIIVSFLVLMLVVIAACGQKSAGTIQNVPAKAAVDSAADSFGNSMSSVNNDENDTSSQQLEGIDQGLSDVENI